MSAYGYKGLWNAELFRSKDKCSKCNDGYVYLHRSDYDGGDFCSHWTIKCPTCPVASRNYPYLEAEIMIASGKFIRVWWANDKINRSVCNHPDPEYFMPLPTIEDK